MFFFATFFSPSSGPLKKKQHQAMQLFVRDLQGSTVTLEAEQQQQVGQLKDRRRWERWIFLPKNWGDIDFMRI